MGFDPGVQLHPDLLRLPLRDSCVALEKTQRTFTGWAMWGKAQNCPIIGFLICEMGTAILAPPDGWYGFAEILSVKVVHMLLRGQTLTHIPVLGRS